jgi:hypothetical protein
MKFNFFDWVREGVKQSVLLGVSDAAEHIGTPAESEQLNQRLTAAFYDGRALTDQQQSKSRTGRGRRKALGRSLSTIIEQEQEQPSP